MIPLVANRLRNLFWLVTGCAVKVVNTVQNTCRGAFYLPSDIGRMLSLFTMIVTSKRKKLKMDKTQIPYQKPCLFVLFKVDAWERVNALN